MSQKTKWVIVRTLIDKAGSLAAAKAQFIRKRYSWRLGTWLWFGITSIHQLLNTIVSKYDRPVIDTERLRRLWSPPYPIYPRYPQLVKEDEEWHGDEDLLATGEAIIYGGYRLHLSALPDQSTDPSEGWDNTPRFHFHTLHWLSLILDYAIRHHRREVMAWLLGILTRWLPTQLDRETNDWIWDDHIAALRCIVLCQCGLRLREIVHDDGQLSKIAGMIHRHAERLTHPWFYRSDHNHGVTQAYALLVAGLLVPLWSRASQWVSLGRARLEAQMATNVTDEGIHIEHSPFYHCYVLDQFLAAVDLSTAYDTPFSTSFLERLKSMCQAVQIFIKPDGRLAAFGDTSCNSFVSPRVQQAVFDVETKLTMGNGQPGVGSSILPSQLFAQSGYALLRTSAEQAQLAHTCLVRLSTFSTAHIHRDTLSFEYMIGDREIVVDAGGPYEYGHREREWFLSSMAHNTVVVDGLDHRIGRSAILHWTVRENEIGLGLERIEAGARVRRTFVLLPSRGLCVVDWLASDVLHRFQQRTHLAPLLSIVPQAAQNGVWHVDGESVRLAMAAHIVCDPDTCQEHQPIRVERGWRCVGNRQKQPVPVMVLEAKGAHVGFGLCIMRAADSHSPNSRPLLWHTTESGMCLTIETDDQSMTLHFDPDGSYQVSGRSPSSPHLFESNKP